MTTIATPQPSAPSDLEPVRRSPSCPPPTSHTPAARERTSGNSRAPASPVPPGFVVGAPSYAAFRLQSGLAERLTQLLSGLDVEDTAALRKAADAARQAVAESEMPGWLAEAIGTAHDELTRGDEHARVAVRSSATAEDTASASFAGMNETFLNVSGRGAVIDAVKRCWMSLFGPRTIYYRGKRGFSHSDMDIAVVVQHQIPSTRAGVMFTIDPATGDHDHLVIEGSFGLGESVVSGQVSPDRYVVDKRRMAIVTRAVRPKELVIEPAPDGGTVTRELTREESHRPVLTDEQVLRVAELGLAIEREYAAPQDTEWAFDPEGNVWMLHPRRGTRVRLSRISSLYFAVNLRRLARSTSSGSGTPAGAARPPATNPSSPTARWSSRPAAAASSAAPAPFVLVSNIPAFSVLALKVHRFLDGERLTGR